MSARWRGREERVPGRRWPALLVAALLSLAATPAAAQDAAALAAECERQAGRRNTGEYCKLVVQALDMVQPRLGLSHAGGNPVAGTASTLGLRLGTMPRISAGARVTVVRVELPEIRQDPFALFGGGGGSTVAFLLPALAADGSIGLFRGFAPAPTIGGVGSVDLLANLALMPVPGGKGFSSGAPLSAAAGLRLGILRESFTVPGVSASAMVRRMGTVTYGDVALTGEDAFFRSDLRSLHLRGAVGKHVLGFGASAGVGWDRSRSSGSLGVAASGGLIEPTERVTLDFDDFRTERVSAFANLSFTLLVLHLVGEVGWQAGGAGIPLEGAARPGSNPEAGALFGSVALRLSI
jgi:hypothetical protein